MDRILGNCQRLFLKGSTSNRAIGVDADLRLGEDRVSALPVLFEILGEGAMAPSNASTDQFGLAGSFFVPPSTGDGTSIVRATSVIDGETVVDEVEVGYEEPELDLRYVLTEISQTSAVGSVNDLGQVALCCGDAALASYRAQLWLPEPAYGLPSGLNTLSLPGSGGEVALDINNAGQVLVIGGVVAGQPAPFYIWKEGTTTSLGAYVFTGIHSRINEKGHVIVAHNESGNFESLLIGDSQVSFGNSVALRGLNDDGAVSGFLIPGPGALAQPLFWPNGPSSRILLSSEFGKAVDLNNSGQVLIDFTQQSDVIWKDGEVTEIGHPRVAPSGICMSTGSTEPAGSWARYCGWGAGTVPVDQRGVPLDQGSHQSPETGFAAELSF